MAVLIIAEAGVNHNGDIGLAKELIEAAAFAGADYVKFQTFKTELLVARNAKKAEYQLSNDPGESDTQYAMLKKLELSEKDHYELAEHCKKCDIKFLSTAFDSASADFLDELGIDLFKIPSGELTNKPLLQHIAKKGKPVILSTGMATVHEVEQTLHVLQYSGLTLSQITVLHCNTEYPTPMKDVNLYAMIDMKEKLHVETGYSDHTLGIEVPVAATALGAQVIEKHFTLDRNLEGPDHNASLEPEELRAMVLAIRNIELATSGSGIKEPSESEVKNRSAARKSIHVSRNLMAGHILLAEDLIMLRPGDGISPMNIDVVQGKRLLKAKNAFDALLENDITDQ